MKIVAFTIYTVLFHGCFFAQIVGFEKKDSLHPFLWYQSPTEPKFIIGTEQEFIVASWKDPVTSKKNRASVQTWEPHLSYFPIKNLGFGLSGKIEFFHSNALPNNTPNVYELGVFTRYILPFQFNVKVFNRLSFSIGASFSKTSYSRRGKNIYYFATDSTYIMFDGLEQNLIRLSIMGQFKIWKGLNLKYSYRYEMFLNNYYKFRPTIGIEYHFYYEEKKKKKY